MIIYNAHDIFTYNIQLCILILHVVSARQLGACPSLPTRATAEQPLAPVPLAPLRPAGAGNSILGHNHRIR